MAGVENRNGDEHDVGDGDDAGLGRRELPREDAAHDDDRDHQRYGGLLGGGGELAERGALALEADGPEEMAVDHQPDADEDAGHHAGEEQPADRDVAGGAVHHRHDAGRDEIGHGGGRGDQCGGEGAIVALAVHFRRDRAREHGDVGGRRAGDAGEEHAEERHHLRQAAAQMPDQRLRQPDHARGDVGRRHQVADQQEERHRHQRLDVHAVEDLRDHRGVADRGERRHQQHRADQREGHRHAHVAEKQEHEAHQHDEHAVAGHSACLFSSCTPLGSAKPWRQPFTICSIVNRATRTPLIGIAA